MNWWKRFKAKTCSTRIKADNKADALREVVQNLIAGEQLPAELEDAAVRALIAREEMASTGIGMGVAIPHVKLAQLSSAVCSLSVHPEGIEWHAVDGAPVQILFTVLRPEAAGSDHDPEQHLEMMRWIARLARESDFRAFALRAKTKTDLVALLKEMSVA